MASGDRCHARSLLSSRVLTRNAQHKSSISILDPNFQCLVVAGRTRVQAQHLHNRHRVSKGSGGLAGELFGWRRVGDNTAVIVADRVLVSLGTLHGLV